MVKEKEDEDARLKSQAKRLDYITRALRIEEMPVLRNKYEAQVKIYFFFLVHTYLYPDRDRDVKKCISIWQT